MIELVPSIVVTKTLAGPKTPAGMVAVIYFELTGPSFTVTLVAAMPPMVTPVKLLLSKLRPLMMITFPPAFGPAAGEILVITGALTMLAAGTSLPLLVPFVVTTTRRVPRVGAVLSVTVNWVAVALVTVPVAPLLKLTVLLAAIGSKPVPVMVSVVALIARLFVLGVTVGA